MVALVSPVQGLTVEVSNTDAEGRLCLADAFTFVQRQYKPRVLLDLATLTGASPPACTLTQADMVNMWNPPAVCRRLPVVIVDVSG